MMALLLDTNAFLWYANKDRRLGRKALELIATMAQSRYLSAVSIWEMATKNAIGRLDLTMPLREVVARAYAVSELVPLSINDRHAIAAAELPLLHRDPFDRMLIAQARVENLKIVTADRIFAQYPVEIVPADR